MAGNINVPDPDLIVFIRNKDLPSNRDANVTDYDLWEAINVALDAENRVRCIQREGDIWRVDLKSAGDLKCAKNRNEDHKNLNKLKKGIKVNEPFPKGVKIQTANGKEKILICGLPCSVKDKEIEAMLKQLGVTLLTDVRTEEICDPDTTKITLVPNGKRYVFISSLENGKCLPRNARCAGFTCRLYHSGQETRTVEVNCYEKICRVCLEPNHDPTSPECWYNTSQSEDVVILSKTGNKITKTFPSQITLENKFKDNIVILNEKDNPLAMFFPCKIDIDEETFNSAEEAYLTKRNGGKVEVQSGSSMEPSHGFEVNSLEIKGWTEHRERKMKDILLAKFDQVEEMRKKLESINPRTVFAEATDDYYWGTGLAREDTEQTHPSQWPGENRLGIIVKEIASERIPMLKITLYSLNARGLRNERKRNILFDWLKNQKFDIVLLQETKFNEDTVNLINNLTDFFIYYHCHAINPQGVFNAGVSVLVKRSLSNTFRFEHHNFPEDNGRVLFLHARYKEKCFVLANVYAPSGDHNVNERRNFFGRIFNFVKNNYNREDSTIMLGGDFNCKLDDPHSEQSKTLLKNCLSELELFDSWEYFKKKPGFTCFHGKNPSRIDYIFLHNNLKSSIVHMDLRDPPSLPEKHYFSDHRGIYCELDIMDK